MTKSLCLLIFSIAFYSLAIAQATVKFSGKLSGIKSEKGAWLTQPLYESIQAVKAYSNNAYVITAFIATKAKTDVLIGADGKSLISPPYDHINILNQNSGLYAVKKQGKYSFFQAGKGVVKELGTFSEYKPVSLFPDHYIIKADNRSRVADVSRKMLSTGVFDDLIEELVARDSAELIMGSVGKWGIIDMKGKVYLKFIYDSLHFQYNIDGSPYVTLYSKGKAGLARVGGKTLAEPVYEDFNESLFRYLPESISPGLIPVKQNGKWGCVDSNGKWIIPAEYDGFMTIWRNQYISAVKGGKKGLLDFSGRIAYPFTFDEISRVDDGFLLETKEKNYLVRNGKSWGLTDSAGKAIIAPEGLLMPVHRRHVYKGGNADKFDGYQDSTLLGFVRNVGGAFVKALKSIDSTSIENYDENGNSGILTYVKYDSVTGIVGGKSGIVDLKGKVLLPVKYDDIGFLFMDVDKEATFFSYLSTPSRLPRKCEYEYHLDSSSIAFVKLNGKTGVVNFPKGYEIIPCEYDSIFLDYSQAFFDASDSMWQAKGYPRYFFRTWKNGRYGFVSMKGKVLVWPQLKYEFPGLVFGNIDSLIKNPSYYPAQENITFAQVVATEGAPKPCQAYIGSNMDDGEVIRPAYTDFTYIDKAKFRMLLTGLVKLADEGSSDDNGTLIGTSDDILLIDNFGLPYNYSRFSSQLWLSTDQPVDSIIDKATGKRAFRDFSPRKKGLYMINYYFSKNAGEWYLKNIEKPGWIANKMNGFDSVTYLADNIYKAYVNGQYAYYDFKHQGSFDRQMSLQYPEEPATRRIACRDCKWTYKKYPATRSVPQFDSLGNDMPEKIENYFIEIPIASGGKYNILKENNEPAFKSWPDEMIIPRDASGYYFSLNDTTSGVYNLEKMKQEGYPFFGALNSSLALRYGDLWKLGSFAKPDNLIGDFQEVKLEGDKWAVKKKKKKKKILYYSVKDLSKIG